MTTSLETKKNKAHNK